MKKFVLLQDIASALRSELQHSGYSYEKKRAIDHFRILVFNIKFDDWYTKEARLLDRKWRRDKKAGNFWKIVFYRIELSNLVYQKISSEIK